MPFSYALETEQPVLEKWFLLSEFLLYCAILTSMLDGAKLIFLAQCINAINVMLGEIAVL